MISKVIPKMRHEIIIELERVTIIEKQTVNQDSNEDDDDAIEVEAKEIIETKNRVTPKNEEKKYEK
jgi:hypothetical protein